MKREMYFFCFVNYDYFWFGMHFLVRCVTGGENDQKRIFSGW
jgi:hypothetical protein